MTALLKRLDDALPQRREPRLKAHIQLIPERRQLRWACFRPNGVAYFGSTPSDAYRRAFPT